MKVCNHRNEKLGKTGLRSVCNLDLGKEQREVCILGSHVNYIILTSSFRRA